MAIITSLCSETPVPCTQTIITFSWRAFMKMPGLGNCIFESHCVVFQPLFQFVLDLSRGFVCILQEKDLP